MLNNGPKHAFKWSDWNLARCVCVAFELCACALELTYLRRRVFVYPYSRIHEQGRLSSAYNAISIKKHVEDHFVWPLEKCTRTRAACDWFYVPLAWWGHTALRCIHLARTANVQTINYKQIIMQCETSAIIRSQCWWRWWRRRQKKKRVCPRALYGMATLFYSIISSACDLAFVHITDSPLLVWMYLLLLFFTIIHTIYLHAQRA